MRFKIYSIITCFFLFSCNEHDQLYKGDWGIEVLEINGSDLKRNKIFDTSMFQPILTFSDAFAQKSVNLKIDTLLFAKCDFIFSGKDSIIFQNCTYSDLNDKYSFNLKKEYETKFKSEYSLILENDKSNIQLKQTFIDYSVGTE